MLKSNKIQTKLKIVLAITSSIFVLEIIGGILSNSLAILADSFHILIDFSAILITLFAFKLANKPHTQKLTFGFHRAEIVAALINGLTFFVIAAFILYEAFKRFSEPPEVDAGLLLPFASVGLAANIVMAVLLKTESKSNLNVKGSYLHVLGDLASSIGVIAGAIIMSFFDFFVIDIVISVGISVLILRSGVVLCKKSLQIFMEGTPPEIDINKVSEELTNFPEITEVHELHVWTLTSNLFSMSVHVKIKPEFAKNTNQLLKKINHIMKEECGITHCTIQIESGEDLINPE